MADKNTQSADVSYYLKHIEAYETKGSDWTARGKKIVERYTDTAEKRGKAQFNILWSNVQTLAPAYYAKPPKPNVERRHLDDDAMGRTASIVIERSVDYYVADDTFDTTMSQLVLDRLLPGRGTAWVRYVPVIKDDALQITEDTQNGDTKSQEPVLYSEDVVADYVNWQDFGHSLARTWEEVPIVWRKVWLSRAELKKRFKKGETIPLTEKEGDAESLKACIYEIWDKSKMQVSWLHKSMSELLDQQPDPLRLKKFFPCPKPLYATLANKDLWPTADYVVYQDQAIELDLINRRIALLTKALRVVGVYDASAEGLQRMLLDGEDNKLVPVENWAVFGEKGGLKGVVDYLPLDMIAKTLSELYTSREQTKQVIYEITGISDIIRGATNAAETATAQQIKGKFATLRLDSQQKEVARFARDLVRMMAEIISEHFDLETIKQVSGMKLMTAAEKQQVQAQQQQQAEMFQELQQQAQMAQQQGQQVQAPQSPPPLPEEVTKLLELPTWEEVEKLLRNDILRGFKVDIETDSTIKMDQDAERDARVEFIGQVGGYIQQMASAPPSLLPLLGELLAFGVRGFKVGRDMEQTITTALDALKKQADQPQPDPEQQKMEAEQKAQAQEDARQAAQQQQEDARFSKEMEYKDRELNLKNQELDFKKAELMDNTAIEHKRLDNEKHAKRLDAKVAAGNSETAMTDDDFHEDGSPMLKAFAQLAETVANTMAQGMEKIAEANSMNSQAVIAAVTMPRTVTTPEGRTYTSQPTRMN